MKCDKISPCIQLSLHLCTARTSQVIEVKDESGKLMNDFTGRVRYDERHKPDGFARTLVVAMDTAQVGSW